MPPDVPGRGQVLQVCHTLQHVVMLSKSCHWLDVPILLSGPVGQQPAQEGTTPWLTRENSLIATCPDKATVLSTVPPKVVAAVCILGQMFKVEMDYVHNICCLHTRHLRGP